MISSRVAGEAEGSEIAPLFVGVGLEVAIIEIVGAGVGGRLFVDLPSLLTELRHDRQANISTGHIPQTIILVLDRFILLTIL